MKRIVFYVSLFLIFLISLMVNFSTVEASKATCTYKYDSNTFIFKYEFGTKVSYEIKGNNTSKYKNKNISVVNEDFIDEKGKIVCPKLKFSKTTVDKQRYNLNVSIGGQTKGVLNLLVSDNKEKENPESQGYICKYNVGTDKEFGLSWDDKLKVYYIGDKIKTHIVEVNFTAKDFADGKCPIVYGTVTTKQNIGKLVISAEPVLTEDEDGNEADSKEDISDGTEEEISGEGNIDPNIGQNLGDPQKGCEVIPEVVRKWINNILNFVRYIALALVIALGALDFMKVAGNGEPDAMKKAGQSFMKRMIAVVILFLLPVIVDFILNMINVYGVDANNIDCL